MADKRPGVLSLVLIPAILTLIVSILRLVGQMQGWNETVFGKAEPGGSGAILGIGWLIVIFGLYFGVRMQRAGHGTKSPTRALVLTLVGLGLTIGGAIVMNQGGYLTFPGTLESPANPVGVEYLMAAIGAGVLFCFIAWPRLALTLLVYAILARIPVVIITWLALHYGWDGTHYTKTPPEFAQPTDDERFMFLAMAQATIWPAATIMGGSLFGCLGALMAKKKG
ncbi:MAG: hypothetical protein AB8H80_16195 [Planctomycetota bacterium]